MHCLVGLHLVALEKRGSCGFLVTFDGCHHLDGFELVILLSTMLVIVWWLNSSDCEGFCTPMGDRKG